MLQTIAQQGHDDLAEAASWLWQWLSDARHRDLLYLWVEAYGRSLTTPQGPWGGFAESTVRDWLQVLQEHLPAAFPLHNGSCPATHQNLAMLRGALLDLLATGDTARVTAAVENGLEALGSTSARH